MFAYKHWSGKCWSARPVPTLIQSETFVMMWCVSECVSVTIISLTFIDWVANVGHLVLETHFRGFPSPHTEQSH